MSGLREALLMALRRSGRVGNDIGLGGRIRAAGETFIDDARPGYARIDTYPERLWNGNEPVHRTRYPRGDAMNDPVPYEPIDDDTLFMVDDLGNVHTRQATPTERAQYRWGVDSPVAKALLLTAGGGGALTLREALAQRMTA